MTDETGPERVHRALNRDYRQGGARDIVFNSIEQPQTATDECSRTATARHHGSLGRVLLRTSLPRPKRSLESSYQLSTGQGSLRDDVGSG